MLVAEATQEYPSLLPWVWNMLSGSSLAVGVLFRSLGDNKEVVSSSNKKGDPDRDADTKGR